MKGYLEGHGIKCWKAPEDIPYGTDWDVGIKNGLKECPVMVLIFSKAADESKHVKIEVHKASEAQKIVIPFKIEDHIPDNLDYYLTFPQWLEAIDDIEGAFQRLNERLRSILSPGPGGKKGTGGRSSDPGEPVTVSDKDKDQLLSILPDYGDWGTNSDLRERLNWSKEKLKSVADSLDRDRLCIYRDGNGGALALKTQQLAELEKRLLNGSEPYPYFVNVGEGKHRHWDDCRKYNFFCAGCGERFANLMKTIPPGSEVYLYLSQYGYVAKGRTTSTAKPMDQFQINGTPLAQLPLIAPDAREHLGNQEMCEWIVEVEWDVSLDRNEAIRKKGLFVHVATSCRIKDPITIQYLRKAFAS